MKKKENFIFLLLNEWNGNEIDWFIARSIKKVNFLLCRGLLVIGFGPNELNSHFTFHSFFEFD